MDETTHALPTRRAVMRLGTSLVAAPALAALGASAAAAEMPKPSVGSEGPALQNPIDQYPKPPFATEVQEPPGLASKMNPRPDHGEASYKGSGKLVGRKALITGGDSGIGRAAAIAFAREGADVAIGYLPVEESDAKEVIDLIQAEGRRAIALPGDIRDEQFCRKLVDDAVAALGGLDILVNNAGRQHNYDSLEKLTTEEFDHTFKVNVYAPFWITKAALPHLPAGAAIVNTASIQGYDPSESLVDYAQTKSCNISFTKSLSKQLMKKGIRVNAVAPGPIWTPLQVSSGATAESLKHAGGGPMGRSGQPAELASVYVFLASKDASFVTGEVYGVTGGKPTP